MELHHYHQDYPMQYMYHAASLNENGFALLQSGKQHEAFETFIGAMESISTLTRVLEANGRYGHGQHRALSLLPNRRKHKQCRAATAAPVHVPDSILCDESLDYGQMSSSMNQRGSNNRNQGDPNPTSFQVSVSQPEPYHNFVYNQAFRFTAPREMLPFFEHNCFRDEGIRAHYIKLCRAVLTFNSALTFHQRSIGAKESVKKTAETVASDLYLDAMNLLHDCYSTLDSYRVLAATLNNAAVLFYEMQDFERFAWFQTELHQLLVDMESTFPKSVNPLCLKCLFFNATLLTPPQTAATA
jgi:hypothetical protein